MLTSVVLSKHWDFYKMGINMSRAFDTIQKQRILQIVHQDGCDDDALRMVRLFGKHKTKFSHYINAFRTV
jgi:hypothetical protein